MPEQDPYASLAKPIDDPYASIAKPLDDAPKRSWGDILSDFGKGMAKGAVHTMSAADDWATQHLPAVITTPIGQTPNHENSVRATQYAQDLSTPTNTAQKVGRGVEQAAEFLIPGGAEEGIGRAIATKFPKLAATGAKLLASSSPELNAAGKILMQSLSAGTVNSAQGGSFAGGATAGAVGGAVGQGIKSLAPTLAEIAMGTRAADRSLGKTPGVAILNETTGVNPGTIAQQAFDKSAGYTDTLNKNALQSKIPVDLQPAREVAASFGKTAAKQRNATNIREIQTLEDQLSQRAGGSASPIAVSADEGLGVRRGVDALMDSWNPNNKRTLSDSAIAEVRKAMNAELSKSVPDFDALNLKISNLIPVAARAGATDLNAGVAQKVLGRLTAPTGALLPAGIGAEEGYRHGGVAGGIAGAAAGLILPHVLTSPTTLMMGARAMNSGASQVGAKALTGSALQAARDDVPELKGAAKWADLGAAKLADHIGRESDSKLSADDVQALRQTSQGKDLLIQASDLKPGSSAMKDLVNRISALNRK